MKDFFNRVYNTLEELWEYYKDMYAVGIMKTSRNRKSENLAADGSPRLQDNLLPLDLTQGI